MRKDDNPIPIAEPHSDTPQVITAERDPFYRSDLQGIFRDHSCWKCNDGEKPCVGKSPRDCGYLRARND